MLPVSADLFACFRSTAQPKYHIAAVPGSKAHGQQAASPDQSMSALELKVRQLSVYASQRRLCITAAVANAFQQVEEGLLLLARPKTKSIAAEIAPAPKVLYLHFTFLQMACLQMSNYIYQSIAVVLTHLSPQHLCNTAHPAKLGKSASYFLFLLQRHDAQ